MAKIEILGEHARVGANHASHLDVHVRLLMLIVDWTIRPTSGSYTRLTEVTAMIMHNVMYGNYANLGEIMIGHIAGVAYHATANVPYGMWLTPIFEHFGVDLSNEVNHKVHVSRHIGERSLVNMGYERAYHRGPWTRKPNRRNAREVEESEEGEDQEEEPQGGNEPEHDDEPRGPTRRMPSGSSHVPYTANVDILEEVRATRADIRAAREAQESFYDEMRVSRRELRDELMETQSNFQNELRESHHSYYSSFNDNMVGMNQFIQSYMASHPAEFPLPPPSEDSGRNLDL